METIMRDVFADKPSVSLADVRHCIWMLVAQDRIRYYVNADDQYVFETEYE